MKKSAKRHESPPKSGRWPLTLAKSRLSEIIRKVRQEGPQIITSHGEDMVELRLVRKRKLSYVPTGTGYDFVLASIPFRTKDGEDEIEFERDRTPALPRPINLP
jgi:hypothetical protein